jgi:magnesium chelatase subunit D
VRGEKGTAKSTAVRALAKLLPPIRVVSGCPYSCDPDAPNPECPAGPHTEGALAEARPVRLVELPVGASTDRLAGTLDIEKALAEGRKAFEPGLLAAAHRGILYVDEVNLLSDHLVTCSSTWRDGREPRRARGGERPAPVALYPRRHDEP